MKNIRQDRKIAGGKPAPAMGYSLWKPPWERQEIITAFLSRELFTGKVSPVYISA
ncbi:hypothetical protein [Chitinophaga barathri]|uniref:hypothetical protein n=1 Tax=Chitinophaga barathri TaxID=1647451 RepID=UPI0013C4935F|nr:hypothetical protein [Chitinophaga barathri]